MNLNILYVAHIHTNTPHSWLNRKSAFEVKALSKRSHVRTWENLEEYHHISHLHAHTWRSTQRPRHITSSSLTSEERCRGFYFDWLLNQNRHSSYFVSMKLSLCYFENERNLWCSAVILDPSSLTKHKGTDVDNQAEDVGYLSGVLGHSL